jgi:hypothetical protein
MTSGPRLEIVGLSRSVRGFHDVQAYFGVFWALSLYAHQCHIYASGHFHSSSLLLRFGLEFRRRPKLAEF